MRELSEQEVVRREKCEKLRELGLDPFGQKYEREDFACDIKKNMLMLIMMLLKIWMILLE